METLTTISMISSMFGGILIGAGFKRLYFPNKQNPKTKNIVPEDIPEKIIKSFERKYKIYSNEEIRKIRIGLSDFINLRRILEIEGIKEIVISMPSEQVDDLWHEFILHTEDYQIFCNKYLDRFLHHKPYGEENNVDEIIKSKEDTKNLIEYAVAIGVISKEAYILNTGQTDKFYENNALKEINECESKRKSVIDEWNKKYKNNSNSGGDAGVVETSNDGDGCGGGGCGD